MAALAPLETDTLPARPDVERSLLGALLIDGGLLTRVMEFLAAEDFSTEAHRLVYDSCLKLADRKEGIDLVTVQSELERYGKLDKAGGGAYLAGLVDVGPGAGKIGTAARRGP